MTNQEIADLRERLTAAHPTTELQRRLEAARADERDAAPGLGVAA